MRVVLHRLVFEVDDQWREKHEQENQRDHHVILDGAALIRPQNVAADGAPDTAHWHRRRSHRGCIDLYSIQIDSLLARSYRSPFYGPSCSFRPQNFLATIRSVPMYGRRAS